MKKVINCNQDNNPLINKKAKEVSVEEGRIAEELFQILNQRGGQFGLAANQVGIDAQVAVVNVTEPLVLINPKYIKKEVEIMYGEGYLSYPNQRIRTKRYKNIIIKTAQSESLLVRFGAKKHDTEQMRVVEVGKLERKKKEVRWLKERLLTNSFVFNK